MCITINTLNEALKDLSCQLMWVYASAADVGVARWLLVLGLVLRTKMTMGTPGKEKLGRSKQPQY